MKQGLWWGGGAEWCHVNVFLELLFFKKNGGGNTNSKTGRVKKLEIYK